MAITVYRSTDASAPVLKGTTSSLIDILDACLVNGYGAKSAAGWTKAFSGTNKAAYRMSTVSPATGFYLRVDDTGTQYARLVGYEAMSDVDTGTGAFPTSVQQSGGLYLWKSSTTDSTVRPWCLVASERSFYLYCSWDQTLFGSVGTGADTQYFFGDIVTRKAVDGYECMILAQTSTANSNVQTFGTSQNDGNFGSGIAGHYIARNYTGIGSSTQVSKGKNSRLVGNYSLGTTVPGGYPNIITQSIDFATVTVSESSSAMRGFLPGFYEPISGINIAGYFSSITGQGSMSGKDLLFFPAISGGNPGKICLQTNGSWY